MRRRAGLHTRPVTRTASWRLTLLGAVVGALNVNFVLQPLTPARSDAGLVVVSELSARGQPWSGVFRLADGSCAVLLLVLSAAMLRQHGPGPSQSWPAQSWPSQSWRAQSWRAASWLVGASGALLLTSVLVPLSCADVGEGRCPGRPPGAPAAWTDLLHDGVSIAGTTAAIAAAAFLVGASLGRLRTAHAIAALVAGSLGLVLATGVRQQDASWFGLVQRAQIVALSAWYVAVGRSVDARRRAARDRRRGA